MALGILIVGVLSLTLISGSSYAQAGQAEFLSIKKNESNIAFNASTSQLSTLPLLTNDTLTPSSQSDKTPLQYIVVLNDEKSMLNSLVNQVKSMGAEIIQVYNTSFTGFTLRASDSQNARELLSFLKSDSRVSYIEPDQPVSIQN